MKPDEYLSELKAALVDYRFSDVRALTDRVAPSTFRDDQVKKALGLIRRKRLFPDLEHAASVFYLAGHRAPVIRRQWAQSLLDQNRVPEALSALETMAADVADDPAEGPEVRGLIGRAYKQLYVNQGGPENLVKAIGTYQPDWCARRGDYRWHGINLAALLARAKRDGIDPKTSEDATAVAGAVLIDIESAGTTGVWDYATAMEASIALDDSAGTLEWAGKYVKHPDTDAFEIASTLRQMKEVWGLQGTGLGNKLLPVLECVLLQREGATLEPTALTVVDKSGFEAIFGAEAYVYLEWVDTMYQRCFAVARVFDPNTGQRMGTGFLVKAESLRPEWGDKPVFVTNAHVVSDDPGDGAPLRPGDAAGEFTRLADRPRVVLGQLLFSSRRTELDVTILQVETPHGATALEPSAYKPVLPQDGGAPQRIYVMGHPAGGELAVSLYDNSLASYEGPYVRYRSPTEGGSSGSPVFSRQWKLFALHHRAIESEKVNEGVLFGPIAEAIAK